MKHNGFSLIELIVAIVIISIGIAGFATLMNASTVNSIDPMVQQQAHAIARAYLEEILLKPFCDPDIPTDCPTICKDVITCSDAVCTDNTGETRATFDDVCDYRTINEVPTDQTATPIVGLENYNVRVDVIDDAGADLNGLEGIKSQVLRIDVNVTGNPNVDITLTGYRTNF